MSTIDLQAEASDFRDTFKQVREEVGRVIVGQEGVIEATLVALFCGGNVLLEGVPGLGKTELVKAMSRVLDLHFRRIQFTPDLMPADIIGTNVMTNDEQGSYRDAKLRYRVVLDRIHRGVPPREPEEIAELTS